VKGKIQMEASFDNTVSILVKAFLEGTLTKGHCCACAVGNICATAIGAKVSIEGRTITGLGMAEWSDYTPVWQRAFATSDCDGESMQTTWPEKYERLPAVKEQIDATGYKWEQLARIEYAFESAEAGYGEAAEFAGLMAVVDVLADIHGIDLASAEVAKSLFVKQAA
jgi:hypothetical protein